MKLTVEQMKKILAETCVAMNVKTIRITSSPALKTAYSENYNYDTKITTITINSKGISTVPGEISYYYGCTGNNFDKIIGTIVWKKEELRVDGGWSEVIRQGIVDNIRKEVEKNYKEEWVELPVKVKETPVISLTAWHMRKEEMPHFIVSILKETKATIQVKIKDSREGYSGSFWIPASGNKKSKKISYGMYCKEMHQLTYDQLDDLTNGNYTLLKKLELLSK